MPKVFHITEIEPDGVKTYDLCENCIEAYFKNSNVKLMGEEQPVSPQPVPENKEQVIQSILNAFQSIIGKPVHAQRVIKPPCSKCGITLEEIIQKGRLGCPHCYEHFENELAGFLQNTQAGVQHVGKVPKRYRRKKSIAEIIESLEDLMAKAVKKEIYELAALLRDGIAKVKKLSEGYKEGNSIEEQKILEQCSTIYSSLEDSCLKIMDSCS